MGEEKRGALNCRSMYEWKKQKNGKLFLYKGEELLNTYATFTVQPMNNKGYLQINDRQYLGSFDFIVENGQYVRPINSVNMEDYLKGVVPIEMYPSWHIEALKTQAVAARTYALSYMNRELIDDTIMYQVYGGYIWTPNTTKEVDETRGQVIQYNGRLIDAVYSASNGGVTESNANAWGSASVPYLTVKEDTFDPKSVWNFSFHKNQINVSQLNLSKPIEWWTTVKEADTTFSNNIKMWLNANGYANKEIKIVDIPEFKLHSPGSGGRMSKGNITVEFFVKDMLDANGNLAIQRVVLQNVNISKIRAMLGTRVMLSYLVDKWSQMIIS
ncbi:MULTISPECIES: SpoIID/LytB domain-containing protein [Neobacillus]|uniref:SpoIID/LytB domain-containing protein n=1 Tax=Neobacillus TaxID=2675232 RepID=UPI0013D3343C|nr:SpoIID/LytB domain-containing protein [Neobacillus sedimentimangrovi]